MVGINLLPFCNRTGHCHINMNHEYINLFFPKRLVWFILIKSEYCSVMLYWIIHLFIKMPTIFKLESNHTGMEANVKKKGTLSTLFLIIAPLVIDLCTTWERGWYDEALAVELLGCNFAGTWVQWAADFILLVLANGHTSNPPRLDPGIFLLETLL